MSQVSLFSAAPAGVTMTSLELVDFINHERKPDEAELRHADFLAKVPKVLGDDERKFSSVYLGGNGQERPCYRFPKREACLMAMSYSYDLQAKVFDRMTALEQQLVAPPPAPAVTGSDLKSVTEAIHLALKEGSISKREAQKQLKAAMFTVLPGMAAALAAMTKPRHQAPGMPHAEQMPLPSIQASPAKKARAKSQPKPRLTNLRIIAGASRENLYSAIGELRLIGEYIEGGYPVLIEAMQQRKLVTDSGRATVKGQEFIKFGKQWFVANLLRACGANL